MPKQRPSDVTVRVRIGDNEIEVTGPHSYVDKQVKEFVDASRHALPSSPQTAAPPKSPAPQVAVSGKPLSPAQFFKKHTVKSDVDRVLIAGYFLEKHRNAENFTAAEIRALISEAKVPPPVNPSDAINKNIKKATMMPAGERDKKLAFVLTSDGESIADQMLTKPSE